MTSTLPYKNNAIEVAWQNNYYCCNKLLLITILINFGF